MVYYSEPQNVQRMSLELQPEVLVMDHTTVNIPVDELLNMAFRLGIQVVDGVFPYHVAATRGWDVVSGVGKWSYTHHKGVISVGPDDDCSRILKYRKNDYLKFTQPSRWTGASRQYGYEIRKCKNGLATYRAVYVGDTATPFPRETLEFNLPMCSSDDMVLVNVNRDLAAGVFTSRSNNAMDVSLAERDYAIEVRRDLFISCVDFLIAKDKGADIIGEAVRYIAQHNYVDLMEGVRVVRCASLGYADALCVSMVCALTAFSLRYRLTNESLPDIQATVDAARLKTNAPFGSLGRLTWLASHYITDRVSVAFQRTRERAISLLYNSDYIPGVCYDVYVSSLYRPDLNWFEAYNLELQQVEEAPVVEEDAFTNFLGDNQKTATATALQISSQSSQLFQLSENKYSHNIIPDPVNSLQHFYDEALPGNSTAQLQNVAELRRVRDININTEFYGKIEVNKDVAAKETLHNDMELRTSALPVSSTPLVDAIMASAKRNFNPPDIQMQSDPWAYARYLVDKFVDFAFIPGFRDTIGKSYIKDPITFNVLDYLEWKATRDSAYRSALEAECPADMVELGLSKYDTIVKRRIKPKMSTAAQYELSQPQVIVSLSKKDTALFTSVFRKIFERFDNSLRTEIKSAGRSSDSDICQWLTEQIAVVLTAAAIEIDSSKYDKSQGLLARMVESLLMTELGLDPGVSEIFADSYVGKVSSRNLGLMFMSAYQMKSGAPQTMLGNIIYNGISAMEAVGPQNIQRMIIKGDDNVIWLVPGVNNELVVNKMSGLFNLDAKLISGNVLYFSSGYIIPTHDKVYFVPDPLKITELLGEANFVPELVPERFISFQDRVASLTRDTVIPRLLQSAMRHRLGIPTLDVVMAIDALASIASNYTLFYNAVKVSL
uniref:RdRp n=1 Tax=Mastic virus Y TaxID=2794237 RepID=A0A7T0M853_9VIRU|nr:RdRp [Mastic virus Y]